MPTPEIPSSFQKVESPALAPPPSAPARNQQWGFAGLILWLLGFLFSFFGAHELLTSLRCGATPRKIDCAQLARGGPPGTAFVTLTNYSPNLNGYIYCQDQQGHWTSADVPLLADGEDTPRVIVHIQQPHSADNLQNALASPELTGTITGRGVFAESSAILVNYNPGMQPETCWILQLNGHPFDKTTMSLVFFGGVALLTLSMWMFVEKTGPGEPGDVVLARMSPLLMLVNGLHALGRWLSLPRRPCGAVLLPFAVAVTAYGAYLFAALTAPHAVAQFGPEILAIGAIQMGVSLLVVAGCLLMLKPRTET